MGAGYIEDDEVFKEILTYISNNPGCSQSEVSDSIDCPNSTLSNKLGRLREDGLVDDKMGWKDNASEYYLSESVSLDQEIVKESLIDYRLVVNFFQVLMGVGLYMQYPNEFTFILMGLLIGVLPNIGYNLIEVYNNSEFLRTRVSIES